MVIGGIYSTSPQTMKLVILSQYFYPEMGAPQNRLYELALGLRELGWEVEIVTAMPNYPTGRIFQGYRGKFYLHETLAGMAIHRYTLYPSKSSRAFPRILSMLSFSFNSLFSIAKVSRAKADYLLVESPPLTLAFSGWIISRFSGAKLIMNVSDLWPLSAKELGALSDGLAYRLLLRLESFLYRRATICTGQSQEIVDHIAIQKEKNNVWLLRNGVDASRFTTTDTPRRTNRIVYAGLLGVAQGILSVLKQVDFAALNLEFHVYGSGNEKEEIEAYLNTHPERGASYHGVLGRDQIPEVLVRYDAALVALVRNIYGAVPSKIYEAMAAGLPVVFSGLGEGARIIKENETGWQSDPGDWPALIDNLRRLRNLPDRELFELKTKARSVALTKFDRKNQIANLHESLSGRTPK